MDVCRASREVDDLSRHENRSSISDLPGLCPFLAKRPGPHFAETCFCGFCATAMIVLTWGRNQRRKETAATHQKVDLESEIGAQPRNGPVFSQWEDRFFRLMHLPQKPPLRTTNVSPARHSTRQCPRPHAMPRAQPAPIALSGPTDFPGNGPENPTNRNSPGNRTAHPR